MFQFVGIRQIEFIEQIYHCYRKQSVGLSVDLLKELIPPQKENEELRRALSDLSPDTVLIMEAVRKVFEPYS